MPRSPRDTPPRACARAYHNCRLDRRPRAAEAEIAAVQADVQRAERVVLPQPIQQPGAAPVADVVAVQVEAGELPEADHEVAEGERALARDLMEGEVVGVVWVSGCCTWLKERLRRTRPVRPSASVMTAVCASSIPLHASISEWMFVTRGRTMARRLQPSRPRSGVGPISSLLRHGKQQTQVRTGDKVHARRKQRRKRASGLAPPMQLKSAHLQLVLRVNGDAVFFQHMCLIGQKDLGEPFLGTPCLHLI